MKIKSCLLKHIDKDNYEMLISFSSQDPDVDVRRLLQELVNQELNKLLKPVVMNA